MSLFARTKRDDASDLIPRRTAAKRGTVTVTNESALRHSAVWASLRLRANLVSTLPLDVFRRVDGRQVEVPKPIVLVNPGGERVDVLEWLYSTQFDLDRAGNCFGIITERDARDRPARIDLVPVTDTTVRVRGGDVDSYRIGGTVYQPEDIWHERQYTLAGLHVGLSPVAHAAWSIGEYLSVQDFALDWFGAKGIPAAHLKNTAKTLTPDQADDVKSRFRSSVAAGDVFVTGNDWDYDMMGAQQSDSTWIEAKQYGVTDIARFFDVPGDLIDANASGSSVTYANITQRNLQLLIMHLGPTIIRRERALSTLVAQPRYVKFNTDALLRMDPKTRAELLKAAIDSRTMTVTEARELGDRAPLTPAQIAEFETLFGAPRTNPTTATSGAMT